MPPTSLNPTPPPLKYPSFLLTRVTKYGSGCTQDVLLLREQNLKYTRTAVDVEHGVMQLGFLNSPAVRHGFKKRHTNGLHKEETS